MQFYKYIQKFTFLILFLSFTASFGIEICDNGVDDDGDGLIDLNDTTDCTCTVASTNVSSLIPNPSFEEKTCCPSTYSQMYCAKDWIQASYATSDYQNTCNFLFSSVRNRLIPFPDGNGIVGGFVLSDYKEYVGACLTNTMLKDTAYSMSLYIAAVSTDNVGYGNDCSNGGLIDFGPLDITIFGSASCNNLTYSGYGCPGTSWVRLGSITYTPINKWTTITIEFTPSININAIILGAPCVLSSDYKNLFTAPFGTCFPYFLYDNLLLNKSSLFSSIVQTGKLCTNNVVLTGKTTQNASYQWYLNGVALVGKTDSILNVSANGLEAGTYSLVSTVNGKCSVAASKVIATGTSKVTNLTKSICQGDSVKIGTQTFKATGNYSVKLSTFDGCDSTVNLALTVNTISYTKPTVIYCKKDSSIIDLSITSLPSNNYTVKWINGIDTTISNNSQYKITDTISGNISFEISYGNNCKIQDTIFYIVNPLPQIEAVADKVIVSYNETVQLDIITTDDLSYNWTPTKSLNNADLKNPIATINQTTIFTVNVTDKNNCKNSDTIKIEFLDNCKNIDVFIPTAFSPNGDGINDCFMMRAKAKFNEFQMLVFNRYGEKIFESNSQADCWNGTFKNASCSADVYAYSINFKCVDGSIFSRKGNVTLFK